MSTKTSGVNAKTHKPSDDPSSMLEVYMRAISPQTEDDFLSENNLRLGNYDENEYWLQVESYRYGMYAQAGMTRRLMERARYETKCKLVDDMFDAPEDFEKVDYLKPIDFPDTEGRDRRDYFEQHADDVWGSLGFVTDAGDRVSVFQHQADLVAYYTGIEKDWTPPHWRMIQMRHDASASKNSQALDNTFNRVQEGSIDYTPKEVE